MTLITIGLCCCAMMAAMETKTTAKRDEAEALGLRQAQELTRNIASIPYAYDVHAMRVGAAKEIVGGLSNPSKMPCKSYSLPAAKCNVGSKLRDVSGSTCSGCYARTGCYQFASTITATTRRYHVVTACMSTRELAVMWATAMSVAIGRTKYFRWHDAGDVQSFQHLSAICMVADLRPDVEFWLPTREYRIVREYLRSQGRFPTNLCVRISAPMRDEAAPQIADETELVTLDGSTGYLPTSGVHDTCPPMGTACDAYTRQGECGDCRKCWNPRFAHISYPRHSA